MSKTLEKHLPQTAPLDLRKAFDSCTSEQLNDLRVLLNYLNAKKQKSRKGNCSRLSLEEKICIFIYVDIKKKSVPEISFIYRLSKNSIYYAVKQLRTYCKILNISWEKINREKFLPGKYCLTNNEQEILLLLANGYSTWEIAKKQQIAIVSVETQIRTLYRKTGTYQMQGLIVCALKNGIVAIDGFNCCFLGEKAN